MDMFENICESQKLMQTEVRGIMQRVEKIEHIKVMDDDEDELSKVAFQNYQMTPNTMTAKNRTKKEKKQDVHSKWQNIWTEIRSELQSNNVLNAYKYLMNKIAKKS